MTWDRTGWADNTAYEMHAYYDANRPLTFVEMLFGKRSTATAIADDLMIGLMNVALNAEREYRVANDPTIPHLTIEKVAIYEEALRKIAGGCCHPARPGYHNSVSMTMIAKDALHRATASMPAVVSGGQGDQSQSARIAELEGALDIAKDHLFDAANLIEAEGWLAVASEKREIASTCRASLTKDSTSGTVSDPISNKGR